MVGLPLVVLALQPDGLVTLSQARSYVAECRSRKRHQIICCECGLPPKTTTPPSSDLTAWAYGRAVAALAQYEEAIVGIGLHSTLVRLINDGRITPIRMVSAALVTRDAMDDPIILATSNTTTEEAAKMVAQAISSWGGQKRPLVRGRKPLLGEAARRAMNMRTF